MTTLEDIAGSWRADLTALATELYDVSVQAPGPAMLALSALIDNSSPTSVIPRLRAIRSAAAQAGVDLAGSQAELARQLGVSQMAVSFAVRAPRPHADRYGREPGGAARRGAENPPA
jgi:hypothetical protein